ncbi:peroxisome proliferator-activated receptor gamma coactivator-related protein 1 [Dendropsophus ebraccatus]|uniref:peroxisome proliferator-activated receptor gamma coactivator-related protein 1 n=1 Tax=Dendropsophus ebraccatus TaxID=150705 RepID=UPI00383233A5
MAARWGAGEETLTIGGMELFTAGGPLQCHDLEEDETCDGLSDLALSSLDAGGLLGTFQGYIDNSIISIIDDPGTQAEHKDAFDEENELSLLTALTEILDNADDENMSPFDTIPDTELLVSPKDRDGCTKFLALSRTPPDHDMFSMDGQRRANSNKIVGSCSGPNWELFPDTISSTPKRPIRHKSVRGCLPRRAEAEETRQRSDGEDEDVTDKKSGLPALEKNFSTDIGADVNDVDHLMQGTPYIINTENVALNELVKYMHPYCLPAITMCLEQEDDENLLEDAVFLEIVSDQGECIKVPVVVEPPVDMLCSEDSMEGMDDLPNNLSPAEPDLDMNQGKEIDCIEKSDNIQKPIEENLGAMPKLEDSSPQPPEAQVKVDKSSDDGKTLNMEQAVPSYKKNSEPQITTSVTKEKAPLKGKKSSKEKQPSKLKPKSKVRSVAEDRFPDSPVASIVQPPMSRPSNPALQESDFLIKTLDQVKKESQMELRSSRMGRTKTRGRVNLDSIQAEKKMADVKVKPVPKEEQAKGPVIAADAEKELEQKPKVEDPKCKEVQEGLQPDKGDAKDAPLTSDERGVEESSTNEESGASKVEDGDSSQLKEAKPKSLSLSEYRKRLQHRKPDPSRDNENLSCSKWPTVPEPPKELAELPCLVIPTQSTKASVEEKACLPNKASNASGQVVPVSLASAPTKPPPIPVISQEVQPLNEKPCLTINEAAPPPVIPPQTNVPPPFYPPTWPTIPPHPSFYPGMPPLPAVPHFPAGMPSVLPVQPPPVMTWPPFPPPPVTVPPVHPTGWVSGPPAPYWPSVQMAPGLPESQPYHPSPEQSVVCALPEQMMVQEAVLPPMEYRPQTAVLPIVQTTRTPVPKPETSVGPKVHKPAAKPETIKHDKSSTPNRSQVVPPAVKADASLKAVKISANAPPLDLKKANVPIADLKSANQVVFKIMEILKKAQKLGFQIKPSSDTASANTQQGLNASPSASVLKPEQPKQAVPTTVKVQVVVPPVVDKSSAKESSVPAAGDASVVEKSQDQIPVEGSIVAQKVAEDKPASSFKVSGQEAKEPVVIPQAEPLCAPKESVQTAAESDLKEPETCESGIKALDLTNLLEQFEQFEAKEEEHLPQSPDKLAVGNSGSGKTMEKKITEKHLAPELVNTAGLTPPATPPHQLWKSVVPGPLAAKTQCLNGQEKTCSPLKTTKLIEPKPLPQNRLKNRNVGPSPSVALPPIHVASGDHDYCILSSQRPENKVPPAAPSQCEEGSRWNVKHHQNITIKPIVQFNKRQQNKACPKQPASSAPSAVTNQSTACGPAKPTAPCDSIQNVSNDPLDHRTNVMTTSAVTSPPGSVLMSPDSSPCRSENGESRTDVTRGSTTASRRSLRCYRKYKGSPSPQKSWRGRSSGSRSDSRSSSSSSSSRSRSGSPASKRRRISRYRSRSRHRSRSSSRSSYGTSSSSRSSSFSSRSYSPSSSQSRSRSRSPYRRRYRSRSRRCESRESYNRRKMFHKERAIEERRVVYIGKINSQMTRSELRRRFSVFGEIEECTIHFRQEGDNYGFVTYRCTGEAFAAIENGHKLRLPDELPFDLCFGGRRQFCKSNYADLDSNLNGFDPAPIRSKFESLDFDTLLRQAQKTHRR